MTGDQVIQMLDQTVDWYRTLGIQQQAASEPSDVLILYGIRQIADEVLRAAFDIARANADLLGKQQNAGRQGEDSALTSQGLNRLRKRLDAQALSVQGEIDSAQRQIAAAPKSVASELKAKIAELQGELDLVNAKRNALADLAGIEDGGAVDSNAGALRAQIDAMAVALPAANAAAPSARSGPPTATAGAAPTAGAPAPASSAASNPLLPPAPAAATSAIARFGLWDLAANALRLWKKLRTVDSIERRTGDLQTALAPMQARLVDQLRALSARGDALAAQADTADGAALGGLRDQFDALAHRFTQLSAIFIPMSREAVLLKQYRRNLKDWRDAVEAEGRGALRTLGFSVGALLAVLTILFTLTELWRRAVLRYVQDPRRRSQLLLLQKIAFWSLVVIIVGLACASELGSTVTFAGLITAGLAVAMQSVLVSIVGYFFLIGKYGIRVGDRVQIGEVNGEVIDLGIVRMYLMEFSTRGSPTPTGRVVAFANSVVFQVSSGLFKQIPGVDFSWHEVTLGIPAGVEYASAKQKLTAAAIHALSDYRDEIQRQTREIKRTTSSNSGGDALPTVQLIFSAKGVEARVRYPVHMQNAVEIDERMSQALLQAISSLTATNAAPAPP